LNPFIVFHHNPGNLVLICKKTYLTAF